MKLAFLLFLLYIAVEFTSPSSLHLLNINQINQLPMKKNYPDILMSKKIDLEKTNNPNPQSPKYITRILRAQYLKFLLSFISLLLLRQKTVAQYPHDPYECATGCCASSGVGTESEKGRTPLNCATCLRTQPLAIEDNLYLPTNTTAIKHVQINLIFIRNNAGVGGFDIADDDKLWDDIEGFVNYRLSNLSTSQTVLNGCYDGLISDSRIRFNFNRYEINNSVYWDNHNTGSGDPVYGCPNNTTHYLNPLDIQVRQLPGYNDGINIYLNTSVSHYNEFINNLPFSTPTIGWACSMGSDCDVDNSRLWAVLPYHYLAYRTARLITPGPGEYYDETEATYHSNNRYWWMIDTYCGDILHEVGHTFFDEQHHADLSCTDNIMKQSNNRSYFRKIDLAEAHRMMTVGTISKYVTDCDPQLIPYQVTSNMLVDYDWRSYQNIIVKSG